MSRVGGLGIEILDRDVMVRANLSPQCPHCSRPPQSRCASGIALTEWCCLFRAPT